METDTTEPPAELEDIQAEVKPDLLWSRDLGDGSEELYLKLQPAFAEGRVLSADREGVVSAYDSQTGEELWTVKTELDISGGPGTGPGVVLVGSSDGEVVAFSAADGTILWRAQLSSEVLAAPVASGTVAVARTGDGKLFGLSLQDGTRLWVYDRTVPVLTLRGTSTPAIAGDAVVAGFDSGRLVALRLEDGLPVWERRIAVPRGRSELERLVDIDADPVIRDEVVYAVSFQGRVVALDLLSGDTLWRRDMSSHSGLGVGSRNVYVTDDRSHIWALDRQSSGSLWRQQGLQARSVTAPAPTRDGNTVVVADFEGYVHWLAVDDGRIVGRAKVGGGVIANPIVVDDTVFVLDREGELSAFVLE